MSLEGVRLLTYDEVGVLHADQIRRYGGGLGIRDSGLLRSALTQPEARFGGAFLHDSVASMASASLYHLVQNHLFVDGNDKFGAACAALFLAFNGYEIDPELSEYVHGTEQTPFELVALEVAQGRLSKDQL